MITINEWIAGLVLFAAGVQVVYSLLTYYGFWSN